MHSTACQKKLNSEKDSEFYDSPYWISMKECPVCHKPLKEKFTWRGILWAIFCFPCGMFCCFRRRTLRCKTCDFEVIISDGSIPRVARAYKSYNLFKWQFSFRRNFSNSNQSPAVDTQTPENNERQQAETGLNNS